MISTDVYALMRDDHTGVRMGIWAAGAKRLHLGNFHHQMQAIGTEKR